MSWFNTNDGHRNVAGAIYDGISSAGSRVMADPLGTLADTYDTFYSARKVLDGIRNARTHVGNWAHYGSRVLPRIAYEGRRVIGGYKRLRGLTKKYISSNTRNTMRRFRTGGRTKRFGRRGRFGKRKFSRSKRRFGTKRRRLGLTKYRRRYVKRRPRLTKWITKAVAEHRYRFPSLQQYTCPANVATWIGILPINMSQHITDWIKWNTNQAAPTMAYGGYKIGLGKGGYYMRMKNNAATPHDCTMYLCKIRADIPTNQPSGAFPALEGTNPAFITKCFQDSVGESLMAQATAVVQYTDPFAEPTDSQLFTQYFKVLKRKVVKLPPGGEYTMSLPFPVKKFPVATRDIWNVNASTDTTYTKVMSKHWNPYYILMKCRGDIGSGATSGLGTTTSAMIIESLVKRNIYQLNDRTIATGVYTTTSNVYNAVGSTQVFNQPAASAQS